MVVSSQTRRLLMKIAVKRSSDVTIQQVLGKLSKYVRSGKGYKALCPVHNDHNPSLSIWEEADGVKFKCWANAGCTATAIRKALFLETARSTLSSPSSSSPTNQAMSYHYKDKSGLTLYRIRRTADKRFFVEHKNNGEFLSGLGNVPTIPYRLEEIDQAIRDRRTIFIPEGEKDVESLRKLGLVATCNPFGAGKWKLEFSEYLKGAKRVIVLPDNDKPGHDHAQNIVRLTQPIVSQVKILHLPGLAEKEDVSDWISRGGTSNELFQLVAKASLWTPQSPTGLTEDFHPTDVGNAERFIAQHKAIIRYCHPMSTWFVWDGMRWAADQKALIYQLATETIKQMYEEASSLNQKSDREASVKHVLRSESKMRVDAMVYLASKKPEICLLPEDFDKNPMLFNVLNGTIDLRTGRLRKHDQEDYITKLASIRYDSQAKCEGWMKFLDDISCGNVELQDYLQAVVGYCLTGSVAEQKLFFLFGQGANGKSVFLRVLMGLFGDYGTKTASEFLLRKPAGTHTTDVTDLKGVRLAITVEVGEGQRMAESLVKELTGGDIVKARRMRQDNMAWDPTHKIWLAANHKPIVNETTIAIWRRIDLIPFDMKLPPEKQIRDLHERLLQEKEGMLQWALRGCLTWQKIGLKAPNEVVEATRQYRSEMDVLSEFFEDLCVFSPSGQVARKRLSEAYESWCNKNGIEKIGQKNFCARLREKGVKDSNIKGERGWLGISLRPALTTQQNPVNSSISNKNRA